MGRLKCFALQFGDKPSHLRRRLIDWSVSVNGAILLFNVIGMVLVFPLRKGLILPPDLGHDPVCFLTGANLLDGAF